MARCLRKVQQEGSRLVLIAPTYPVLIDLLIDNPILLPTSQSLLADPFNRPHSLVMRPASHLESIILQREDVHLPVRLEQVA